MKMGLYDPFNKDVFITSMSSLFLP